MMIILSIRPSFETNDAEIKQGQIFLFLLIFSKCHNQARTDFSDLAYFEHEKVTSKDMYSFLI